MYSKLPIDMPCYYVSCTDPDLGVFIRLFKSPELAEAFKKGLTLFGYESLGFSNIETGYINFVEDTPEGVIEELKMVRDFAKKMTGYIPTSNEQIKKEVQG